MSRIEHEGETLQLVVEDIRWEAKNRRGMPEKDDMVRIEANWLAADGKSVYDGFTISLPMEYLYDSDIKPEELRSVYNGIGRKIVHSIEQVGNSVKEVLKKIRNGQRDEICPQAHRLALANTVDRCMDLALKGGVRKASTIDEKIATLTENHRKYLNGSTAEHPGAPAPESGNATAQKIADKLERLQSVAPELRYWAQHREDLVDKLKDDAVDDDFFAEALEALRRASLGKEDAMDVLPFSREPDEHEPESPARDSRSDMPSSH